MRILGLPYTTAEGMVEANVDGAIRIIIQEIKKSPVDLVVLPEMFTAGYAAANLAPYAEPINGPSMAKFRKCSDELGVAIGYGFAETSGQKRVYNSWALVEPGSDAKIYRKTHLHPSCQPTVNEPDFLLAGDSLEPMATRLGKLGVMICYDGCFIEVPRTLTLRGADVIIWPTRSGTYLASQSLPALRAMDNTIPIVQVEGAQTGTHLPLRAWSVVASATGTVVLSQKDDATPFRVDVDIEEGRRLRASTDGGARSLYSPRRPELYGAITQPVGRPS